MKYFIELDSRDKTHRLAVTFEVIERSPKSIDVLYGNHKKFWNKIREWCNSLLIERILSSYDLRRIYSHAQHSSGSISNRADQQNQP